MSVILSEKKLPSALSVYIDLLRVLAALLVMASHFPLTVQISKTLSAVNYAYDAVVVFFVLSGYVISYAAEVVEGSLKNYAINRVARIMPVAIGSVIFAMVTCYFLSGTRPLFYGDPDQFNHWWQTVIQSLTFTNQAWRSNEIPFGNGPYWSLAFEVWCYVFYAVILFSRGWVRIALFLLLAVALGPKQLIILPMWLAGAAAYHAREKIKIPRSALIAMLILPIAIYWCVQLSTSRDWSYAYAGAKVESVIGFGIDGAANFGWGYFLAVMFAVHLLAFGVLCKGFEVSSSRKWVRLIRWLAGYTFTLYLFHLPIIKMFMVFFDMGHGHDTAFERAPVYALTFVLVYLIGNVVEHKKSTYRTWALYVFEACSQIFRPRVKA